MSIEIKFPDRLNSVETQVYVITETRNEQRHPSGEIVPIMPERRTIGTVYYSPMAGNLPYTERITANQNVYPIGRKGSLLSAISGLIAFHKLTNYQHAPWELDHSEKES